MTDVNLPRRRFLQMLLVSGSTAALAACGDSSGSGVDVVVPPGPTTPTPGLPPEPETLAMELPLSAGPLMDIGPLQDSGVDGILIPEGFRIRRVAISGLTADTLLPLPSLGIINYPWHIFPDGGAVFDLDDGGWIYVSNSEIAPGGGGWSSEVQQRKPNHRQLSDTSGHSQKLRRWPDPLANLALL